MVERIRRDGRQALRGLRVVAVGRPRGHLAESARGGDHLGQAGRERDDALGLHGDPDGPPDVVGKRSRRLGRRRVRLASGGDGEKDEG